MLRSIVEVKQETHCDFWSVTLFSDIRKPITNVDTAIMESNNSKITAWVKNLEAHLLKNQKAIFSEKLTQ